MVVNLIFCFPNFTFLFYFGSRRFVRSFLVRSEFLLFLNSIFGVISFLKFWSGSDSELFLNSLKFCFVVPVGFNVGNQGWFENREGFYCSLSQTNSKVCVISRGMCVDIVVF